MTLVIADQAKNLKLLHERKKDENDNLIQALREVQSESITQERFGKLYFIIMLSRWQEAAVNKKYELTVQEVKEMRGELLGVQQSRDTVEKDYNEAETVIERLNLEKEKLK
eukprot:CAMPEP_0176341456 /NCGR_PEP_ID=MMETSP0126-20121128/2385_1 /TAXON_ID=141414 ORGANISM="Strombidinopsis acuminatum, Strain SPMC142" /NCGR_SAMPLE_ID=MMETSP0126 /ASSEMBLY_ACC=CAM_ASM_000229 /LENGTH=110 /DNA_ID=CAMNT_0017686269 /DNA_START=861 /DNA_END=1193 /DNA_ORIENTATION=-